MITPKRFIGFPLLSILMLVLGACGSLATAQEAPESARVPSSFIAVTPSPSNIFGSTDGVTSAPETGPSRLPASRPIPSATATSAVAEARAKNLELIGLGKRLLPGATTDIWVHRDYAYLGTFDTPCGDGSGRNGSGIRIFDVSEPDNPTEVSPIYSYRGNRINDLKVASLKTSAFEGDVLVHSNEACVHESDDMDGQVRPDHAGTHGGPGGFEIYNVTEPLRPIYLASVRINELNEVSNFISGGVTDAGVHNVFIFTQGERAFVAVFAETTFDNFRIFEITDPSDPTLVGTWGAEELFDPGVGDLTFDDVEDGFPRVSAATRWLRDGFGSLANRFLHDITINKDGDRAYLSNWDAGLVLLDVSDPANPTLISVADPTAGPGGEGNSHAAWPNADGSVVVETTEDFDFGKLAIRVISGPLEGTAFAGVEGSGAEPPPRLSDHGVVTGELVFVGRGCPDGPQSEGVAGGDAFLSDPAGKIAVVRRGACTFSSKVLNAQAAGAVAVVIANDVPGGLARPWPASDPAFTVPALLISTADGDAIEESVGGNLATIDPKAFTDLSPWGFVRIWDYSDPTNPVLASTFNTVNSLNEKGPADPRGTYSVHNVMVEDQIAYLSWYSDGILMLDISDPYNPVEIARYHVEGPEFEEQNGGIQEIWGIYKPEGEEIIYASDRNGGLYVLKLSDAMK